MQTGFATLTAASLAIFACVSLMPGQAPGPSIASAEETSERRDLAAPTPEAADTIVDLEMRLLVTPRAFYEERLQAPIAAGVRPAFKPVDDLKDLLEQVKQAPDAHLLSSPRIIMHDRQQAQVMLATQTPSRDPQTQAMHAVMQGLLVNVKTAASPDQKQIGVAMEVLTQWEDRTGAATPGTGHDLRLPFGDAWPQGFTGGRFQYRSANGTTLAGALPLQAADLQGAGFHGADFSPDAVAVLLVTATSTPSQASRPNAQNPKTAALARLF